MDSQGRLHMPGFVGQTFDETGLRQRLQSARAELREIAEPEKYVRHPGSSEELQQAKLVAHKRAEMERKLAALVKGGA
jgi:hypothetical protein